MYNPHEALLQEIQGMIKSEMALVLQRLPEEKTLHYYSPQDIADHTPIGVQTIRRKIASGEIYAKKVGRKYLIPANEFERVCKDVKSLKYRRG